MAKMFNMTKNARIVRILIPCILVITLMVGVTVAFLHTKSEKVVNTFIATEPEITITEEFNMYVKKNVGVKNSGEDSINVYVRVMLMKNWYRTKDDGPCLAGKNNWEITNDNKVDSDSKIFNIESEDSWFYCESDGYFYYKKVLPKGMTTENLINEIKLLTDPEDSTYQGLEVIAEAIQADGVYQSGEHKGEKPAEVVWGVTVKADGTIEKQ